MKLLVISDTHGQHSAAEQAYLDEKPDTVIFLGDGLDDAARLGRVFPSAEVLKVKGNCDFFADAPLYICEKFGGVRVYACHGHRHDVKNGLSALVSSAKSCGAQIALFGHTHKALCQTEDGIAVINPGSLGYNGTYAVLNIEDGVYQCEMKSL